MSSELSEHPANWNSVRDALAEVRATHGEYQQFFSDVFDNLGALQAELDGRRKQWELERQQGESELQRQAAQLEADRAELSARRERSGQDAPTAIEGGEQIERLLEDARREWAEIRDSQQEVHVQVARIADAPRSDGLPEVLQEIRQRSEELRSAREEAQAQAEQLAALATGLTDARAQLVQEAGAAADDRFAGLMEEIRQQREELRTVQEASQAQAEQLAAVAAELTQGAGAAGDDQLAAMLEGIRQQSAELRGAREEAQAQAQQLAAVAAGLTDARADSAQTTIAADDDQLAAMLEEIRQQRAEFSAAREASRAQAEQLATLAAELTQESAASGDEQLGKVLEEIRQQRDQLRDAQEASQGQLEQLAVMAAQLTDARTELVEARNEIVQRWEKVEAQQEGAGQPRLDERTQERLRDMERQQASLEQERTVLEAELDAVRNRAAEMAETLGEQKREAAVQQAEWADELKRMRRLLEGISGNLAEGESHAGKLRPDSADPGPGRAGAAAADGDPVLDSVAAQFDMLQKDLARRRAAKSRKPQEVS